MSERMGIPPGETGETISTELQSIVATAEMVNASLESTAFTPASPEQPMVNFKQPVGSDGYGILVQDVYGLGRTIRFTGPNEFSSITDHKCVHVDATFGPTHDGGWQFMDGTANRHENGVFSNEYFEITADGHGALQAIPAQTTQRDTAEAVALYTQFVTHVGQLYLMNAPKAHC